MYHVLQQYVDIPFIQMLQEITRKSFLFDNIVVFIEYIEILKIFPLILYILVIYFATESKNKIHLLTTSIVSAFITILLSRLLQNALPARPRPLYAGIVQFVAPYGVEKNVLADWSSFPSDTSAFAFALVVPIWFHSRRWGLLMTAWALVVVCFPRVFAGYHYLSDIVAGIILAVFVACFSEFALASRADQLFIKMMDRFPIWVHACVFAIMFEAATMFYDVRLVVDALIEKVIPRLLA